MHILPGISTTLLYKQRLKSCRILKVSITIIVYLRAFRQGVQYRKAEADAARLKRVACLRDIIFSPVSRFRSQAKTLLLLCPLKDFCLDTLRSDGRFIRTASKRRHIVYSSRPKLKERMLMHRSPRRYKD